ncbi:MAG: hypothetical protein KC912_20910 [Proteobacteria bacterium]|nr:hypothetical protein [Pseudomonadota bacterium]
MSEVRLELMAPYPRWCSSAWRGRSYGEGGARDVFVLRSVRSADAQAVASARQRLALLLDTVSDGSVLLPESVSVDGGQICWVHAAGDWLSAGGAVEASGTQLPLAAAVGCVARACDVLAGLGDLGLRHPGPTPYDVLIDGKGTVRIAGFLGPRAEWTQVDEAALVGRLGVLLCWLTTGIEPEDQRDRPAHEAGVRRALIRVMSRPGPVVTERFASTFRGMRAWDPAQRPSLSGLGETLHRIADELGSPSLDQWAERQVMRLLRDEPDDLDDPTSVASDSMDREVTDPSFAPDDEAAQLPRVDDPTQEASSLFSTMDSEPDFPHPNQLTPAGPTTGAFGMPVRVGPPAEVVRDRPALPMGFLDAEAHQEESEGVAPPAPRSLLPGWFATAILVMASLMLILVAALLLVYLLEPYRPAEPVAAPRIGEVLSGGEDAASQVVVVRNPSGANLLVRCGDAETRTQGHAMLSTEVDSCSVTAELGGETVSVQVEVSGVTEVSCFDGSPSCEVR